MNTRLHYSDINQEYFIDTVSVFFIVSLSPDLLKFDSKLITPTFYTGGGKVRLCEFRVEIPHRLFELVPAGLLIKLNSARDLLCYLRLCIDFG